MKLIIWLNYLLIINNVVQSIFYSFKELIKNNFIKEINEIKIQCKNDLNLFIKNIAFNQKIKMLKNYLKQIIDKISKKIILNLIIIINLMIKTIIILLTI